MVESKRTYMDDGSVLILSPSIENKSLSYLIFLKRNQVKEN
jgi:hypothetical protein